MQPFLRVLQEFRKVVDSCFGFTLDKNYASYIKEFKNAWRSLIAAYPHQFRWNYKIHVLCCHVPEFVKRRGPLGPYSEQSGESLHSSWTSTWKRYKHQPKTTPEERLLNAVVDFEHRHLALLDVSSNSAQDDEPMSSQVTDPEPMSSEMSEPEPSSSQMDDEDEVASLTHDFEFMSSQ